MCDAQERKQSQTRANAEIVIFIKAEVVSQVVRWAEHRIDMQKSNPVKVQSKKDTRQTLGRATSENVGIIYQEVIAMVVHKEAEGQTIQKWGKRRGQTKGVDTKCHQYWLRVARLQ